MNPLQRFEIEIRCRVRRSLTTALFLFNHSVTFDGIVSHPFARSHVFSAPHNAAALDTKYLTSAVPFFLF